MTGDEDSEVVLNNNSSCNIQISSNSVVPQQKTQKQKDDTGSNGSSLSSEESRQVGVQGRSTELVSEVSSVSGEPLTSVGHPSKNSVFSENDADIISTTALSNSPSVDSNSEVFISGASTSTALCGNGEATIGGGGGVHRGDNAPGGNQTGQLSDAQVQEDPDHVVLSESDLSSASLDQMVQAYHQLQSYIQKLKGENQGLKEAEEKLRLQQNEVSRRENILVMRLATKDQEIHDYAAQINELKNSMAPSTSSLKNSLLDPAVNFIIQKMKKELTETKKKLEDTQNDLNAWKFTADSNTGKRLMAKCRMLYQENEDLGKMITSGRLAKLESDLALQKSLTEEMKKAQSEMDDLVQELDEDVEGMQSTIFFLQQQLREKISNNVANSTSSQISEHLVTVNSSELCAQCRAAQDKKRVLNHVNCSDEGVVKMEVDNSVDHEENSRTQDSINSSENERTLLTQNGEYSPNHTSEQLENSNKPSEKRTTRATRHSQLSKQSPQSVNLNAESTYDDSSSSNKLGVFNSVLDGESNSSSKVKSNSSSLHPEVVAEDGCENDKGSDDGVDGEGNSKSDDDAVNPPSAKRTKLSSGGGGGNNRSDIVVGQLQNQNITATSGGDDLRTGGQLVSTSTKARNGAIEHS